MLLKVELFFALYLLLGMAYYLVMKKPIDEAAEEIGKSKDRYVQSLVLIFFVMGWFVIIFFDAYYYTRAKCRKEKLNR